MHDGLAGLKRDLQRFSETHFSDYRGLCVTDLTPIAEGWENEVYSFVMHYEHMGQRMREDLILRLYPGVDATDKSGHEFRVMEGLHGVGYPVPKLHVLESNGTCLGKPFVIMERIDGRSLGEAARGASPQRYQELLRLFCDLFVQLHTLDWEAALPETDQRLCVDPQTSTLETLRLFEARTHRFEQHAFAPVFEWLRRQLPKVQQYEPCLIHCDYHPHNILLREDDKAFVIDWGSARVLDRRLDLALTFILVGPETAKQVLAEYQRSTGGIIEQIEPFEVAASLIRLVNITGSLKAGAEHLGMRPGAQNLMRRQVGHIQEVYQLLQERTGIAIPLVDDLISDLSIGDLR